MDKRTILVSQLLMTFMMALSMSGIMLLIATGPTAQWFELWPRQFLMAWPIAFILTMIAWPLSVKLAYLICRPATQNVSTLVNQPDTDL
ncbi:hypothetical protein GTGU_02106 [Trabulsiella guamensis ATCC 49490]|uniref:DUF2798 domain-containing protein n=1 Tax=Trabulsiella guamensis ATCC 49490 TaxID=1005994 RepID=A0A085AA75_9ENTR|nr:DUF2798 domain-containing protein [Trabulsiella guamensis]KFC07120.1 hypothetical protein GTGU_02106 [Trabulsiella guamensis ATCC 49490]